MWVSLNEIEQTSLKAARGAGYSWGLAEETGAAARWLAMRGLPFLLPLTAGVLGQMHRLESFDSARRIGSSHGPVEAANRLGPISVLTAFSDGLLPLPKGSDELSLRALAAPVFLLPVLARLSKQYDRPLLIRWPGVAVECRAGGVIAGTEAMPALASVAADWFTVSRLMTTHDEPATVANVVHQGTDVDDGQWRDLVSFAQRTYVPESETSRLRGAGAGLTDND